MFAPGTTASNMAKVSQQRRHIEKLDKAILLLQTKLDGNSLREGDLLNVKAELYEFIFAAGVQFGFKEKSGSPNATNWQANPSREAFLDRVSLIEIKDFQRVIREILASIMFQRDNSPGGSGSIALLSEVWHSVVSFRGRDPYTAIVMVHDFRDAIRLAFNIHLTQGQILPAQLRKCPQCGAYFLLKRRPREDVHNYYCSTKCSRNAAVKAYRERNKDRVKKKESARSRRRYAAKVRSKPGHSMSRIKTRSEVD
jgi:hypothetical protein